MRRSLATARGFLVSYLSGRGRIVLTVRVRGKPCFQSPHCIRPRFNPERGPPPRPSSREVRGDGKGRASAFRGRRLKFLRASLGAQQTRLQRLIAVDRNRKAHDASTLAIDMMAATDPKQGPATTLDDPSEVAAGYRFHAGISSIRSMPPGSGGATSIERHPSIAS